jgi:hypothetical protein
MHYKGQNYVPNYINYKGHCRSPQFMYYKDQGMEVVSQYIV